MLLWLWSLFDGKYRKLHLSEKLFILLLLLCNFCPALPLDQSVSQSIVDALIERSLGEEPKTSERQRVSIWQLFNQCSHSYLQAADRTLNARGSRENHCFSDFYVRVSPKGAIALEHKLTKRFICFNRRRRITIRREASDDKCYFREHMTTQGFTELESAWQPGLFLGFNRKGRFQDPRAFYRKRKCFRYMKIERSLDDIPLDSCDTPTNPFAAVPTGLLPDQETLLEAARENVFDKIKATVD
uniref:Fibroblast growth factor 17 n=1 Tax=Steinernema glaseri TaxID=37863 RepID=A0A1I7ZIU5_9BILA